VKNRIESMKNTKKLPKCLYCDFRSGNTEELRIHLLEMHHAEMLEIANRRKQPIDWASKFTLSNIKWEYENQAIGFAALTLLFFLLMSGFLYLGWYVMKMGEKELSVLNYGELATGTIISIQFTPGEDVPDSVYIEYTFTPSSGKELIDSYDFYGSPTDLKAGDHLEIAYDPQNPTSNLPTRARTSVGTNKWYFWIYTPILVLFFGGLAYRFGYKTREAWRLSKYEAFYPPLD
jgi:hypothetical protein